MSSGINFILGLKMSFYLTLPSNSSMNYFPNNTLAQYTTKLVKPITLEGEWEVALVEILYPYSFDNVPPNNGIYLKLNDDSKVPIPSGRYRSIDHLLKVLNSEPAIVKQGYFAYEKVSGHTHFTYKDPVPAEKVGGSTVIYRPEQAVSSEIEDIYIRATPELDLILGGLDFGCANKCTSLLPADLDYFVPDQMFIYSDIVENQLVGDTSAPLLRTVAIGRGQKNIQKIFISPHYLRVQRRQFDTIDVDIRTRTGEKIPFGTGLVTCKLHFRRV